MKDEELPITGFDDPKGNQFGLRDIPSPWEEELAGDPKYGALYSHKNKCAIIRFLRLGWRLSDPGVPDCNCNQPPTPPTPPH